MILTCPKSKSRFPFWIQLPFLPLFPAQSMDKSLFQLFHFIVLPRLTSLPDLKQVRHNPAMWPMCLPFLLPGLLFPKTLHHSLAWLSSLIKCFLINKTSSDHPIGNYCPHHSSHSPLCISQYNTYNYLVAFIFYWFTSSLLLLDF